MRNVFDQYSQPENKVTHALMSALTEDRCLWAAFINDSAELAPPSKSSCLHIYEQTFPGQPEPVENDAEGKGVPDAWITDDDEWCLVIENKVLSDATLDQIVRHEDVAKRLGFPEPKLLLLTVKQPAPEISHKAKVVEWRSVYRWLLDTSAKNPWAKRAADYLEVLEGRLVDDQQLKAGTMTAFNGIPFGDDIPYSYLEAKRLLGLAMGELRARDDLVTAVGMDPASQGRPAITGRDEGRVWDFLQTKAANNVRSFTHAPHLTLGIHRAEVSAMVTIPNDLKRPILKKLIGLGRSGFHNVVHEILDNMKQTMRECPGMAPRLHAVQRRYPSQRAIPFEDAIISFDLRTCFHEEGPPKAQPQWLDAVYDCLAEKNSNFQTQIGAWFPYRTCDRIREPSAIDFIARTWIGCKPLLKIMDDNESDVVAENGKDLGV